MEEYNKRLIYISHPSSGLDENRLDIERIVKSLYSSDEIFNRYTFVSPVHCYGFMYADTEYNRGLQYCTDLLRLCDEVWIFGDYKNSRGCMAELQLAKELKIRIRIFDSDTLGMGVIKGLIENS